VEKGGILKCMALSGCGKRWDFKMHGSFRMWKKVEF